MSRQPPVSTLFPYTTLFRSMSDPGAWVSRMEWIFGIVRLSVRPPATSAAVTLPNERPLTSNRSEEHTSELQSRGHLVCRLLLEKKKTRGFNNREYMLKQGIT